MGAAKKETYNGWTNYETWAVNLWLTNDQGLYNYWLDKARSMREDAGAARVMMPRTRKRLALELAEELKQWPDDAAPWDSLSGTVWADLLQAAIGEVDWLEIATAFLAD